PSAPGTRTALYLDGLAGANGFNLTNANTFTGDVSVGTGTLGIASNASLGNPGNLLFLGAVGNVATLEFLNSGSDLGRPIFLGNGGTGRFLVPGVNTDTVSGSLAGGGLL